MMSSILNTTHSAIPKSPTPQGIVATIILALFMGGCTAGSPSISVTQDLPPIELETYTYESKMLATFDVNLSGRVVKIIDRLEVSLDDGASWENLENNGASSLNINLATCTQNCAFSYGIDDVGTRWPQLMNMAVNDEKRALLRGQSLYGATAPTAFTIRRLKAGAFAVGALSLNELGGGVKTLASGSVIKSGRLEAQEKGHGATGQNKARGVIQ